MKGGASFRNWAILSLLVLSLCVYIGAAGYFGAFRTLYFVNGLGTPYEITINGTRQTLPPLGVLALPLGEGTYNVASTAGPPLFAEARLELTTPFWSRPFDRTVMVINPDRMAILAKETMLYGKPGSLDEPEQSFHSGQAFHRFESIDYAFRLFPRTIRIQADEEGETRTRVQTLNHLGPSELLAGIETHFDKAFALEWLSNRARHHRDTPFYLRQLAMRLPPETFCAFLEKGLWQPPLQAEWHKAYQDLLPDLSDGQDRLASYRAHLSQQQADGVQLYLLGRLAPRAEETRSWFEKAAALNNPEALHGLAFFDLANGRFEQGIAFADRAVLARPGHEQFRETRRQLLLALGKTDILLKENQALQQLAPRSFEAILEEIQLRTLTEPGDPLKELQARFIQTLAGIPDPQSRRFWQHWMIADRAYRLGNREVYAAHIVKAAPALTLHGALVLGKLDLAETVLSRIKQPTHLQHLFLSLFCAHQKQQAKADAYWQKALGQMAKGTRPEREAARLLAANPVAIAGLPLDPSTKRVLLTLVGLRHPEAKAQCWPLAKTLNFERIFPYLLLETILNKD